jgi:hypothetical protein
MTGAHPPTRVYTPKRPLAQPGQLRQARPILIVGMRG